MPTLNVDVREPPNTIAILKDHAPDGWDLAVDSYEVADYYAGQRIGIERKTVGDFHASVRDERLFQQAHELADNFSRAIVVVDGTLDGTCSHRHGVGPERTKGAVASVTVRYGCAVLFSGYHVPAMIWKLVVKATDDKVADYSPRRDSASPQDHAHAMLCALPGIGSERAESLLSTYGSAKKALDMADQWHNVEGIGQATQDKALEVLGHG